MKTACVAAKIFINLNGFSSTKIMKKQVNNNQMNNALKHEQFIVWKPELKCPECRREFSVQGKRK